MDSSPVPSVSKLGLEEEKKNQEEKKILIFLALLFLSGSPFGLFKKANSWWKGPLFTDQSQHLDSDLILLDSVWFPSNKYALKKLRTLGIQIKHL